MAGGPGPILGGKHYEGKFTWYVFFAALIASSGGLIFGYDIGISGGVTSMDEFLMKFFPNVYIQKHKAYESDYCKYDSQILQLFSSSLYIAGLLAAFAASLVNNKYGRTTTIFWGGITFLIGGVLTGFAQNLVMLILGRISLGIGVGFCAQTIPMYLSEIAPSNWRGALNITFQLAITVGILFANVVNYGTSKMTHDGWRLSLGIAIVPAIIVIIGGSLKEICPETPNSLIERNLKDEGKKVLQKIRGVINVEVEYNDIVEATELAKQVKNPFRTLFSKKYRPQLILSIFIPLLQQLTGINVVMFYAPVLFNTLGLGGDDSLSSAAIVGGVNIVATFVSIILVDKVGRRALFLEGGIQMIMCQAVIAGVLAKQFGGDKILPVASGKLVLVMICFFVAAFAWSWGPLGWLVPSEILPLEVRSAGQAIVVSVNLFFTAVIAQVFLTMLCRLQYWSFIFFALWEIIATLFVFFLVPETKNIPIEEVVTIWRNHWFWNHGIPEDQVINK